MDPVARMFKDLIEEAPANNVGSGNIAGAGVGPDGEPGVKRTKYQKKNEEEAPEPVMSPIQRRKSFREFMKGR